MDVVEKFRRYFYVGAAFLVITLLLALIIMISNTIRLTIYARKELIQNMQFVGATDLFIKIPFIIEGIIQGLFGALISIGFFYLIKTIAIKSPIYWGPEYMPYAIIVMGVTFGCIGSISAVRKFLS